MASHSNKETNKRFGIHPLLWAILMVGAFYALFRYAITPPIPKSLLIQYMIFTVIGIWMVVSFDDEMFARFSEPLQNLFGNPRLSWLRWPVFLSVALGGGWLVYQQLLPNLNPPVELRSVHPAPPNAFKAFGKRFNLSELSNPFRVDDPEAMAQSIQEGGEIYFKNCFYCHGDQLDGLGHYADGFNPLPANFQDVGTIAQLTESYLFWRITTGGPGLPREGTPWNSAMPVWHEMLEESDVWKVILFLYDYTGHIPRSWDKNETLKAPERPKTQSAEANYAQRCAWCHGDEGAGDGPAAEFLYPRPRDFTLGMFKYKTTPPEQDFPTDEDLVRIIKEGLVGTSMPGWKAFLSDAEIKDLVQLIKKFGEWNEEEMEGPLSVDLGTPTPPSPESIARGKKKYEKTCVQCHGEEGRGNITSGKKLLDDWSNRIWPRNLTQPWTWRATNTPDDIFKRLSVGILGTPMPEHTTTISKEDRWDIVNYVWTLRDKSVPLDSAKTVLAASRIEGDLPTTANDAAWQRTPPITFRLVPNMIKDPRLFTPLVDALTVRALYNREDILFLLEVDDRTYSIPGEPLEKRYRIKDVEPKSDAFALQLPAQSLEGTEKPLYRHGDKKHPVNIWYWQAGSKEPEIAPSVMVMDGTGPNVPPEPRAQTNVTASGTWKDGRWQVLFRRPLTGSSEGDIHFEPGHFTPISFANWDGTNGESGGRHTLTSWYWLLLEPEANPAKLYGVSIGTFVSLFGLLVWLGRRQRHRFTDH